MILEVLISLLVYIGAVQTEPVRATALQFTGNSVDSVYVFLSPTCPVCKTSAGALRQLSTDNPNVAFVGVVDTATADSAEVAEFYSDYKLRMDVRWDSKALAERFKATTTPEVVVVHNGRRVYQGRINNQYAALGKKRRVVSEHDLRDVLDELARGAVPSFRRTVPVGCYLEK